MLDIMRAALFDLDGVIVDTAKYHYKAWKKLAGELGLDFSEEDNEKLKGVNRYKSLEIILEMGNIVLTEEKKQELMKIKNDWYVGFINSMKEDEILPGAVDYIKQLKAKNIKIGLGSASKNAVTILKSLNILSLFDVIIDGTKVKKSKPDPEVFTKGGEALSVECSDCVVFEDSRSGVEAAINAGMFVVGIGNRENLPEADIVVAGLEDLLVRN